MRVESLGGEKVKSMEMPGRMRLTLERSALAGLCLTWTATCQRRKVLVEKSMVGVTQGSTTTTG